MLHGLCGVPEAVAVLIGSMSFLVMLFAACPAASFISSTSRAARAGHVKLREMREEVATLEHEITEANKKVRRDLSVPTSAKTKPSRRQGRVPHSNARLSPRLLP